MFPFSIFVPRSFLFYKMTKIEPEKFLSLFVTFKSVSYKIIITKRSKVKNFLLFSSIINISNFFYLTAFFCLIVLTGGRKHLLENGIKVFVLFFHKKVVFIFLVSCSCFFSFPIIFLWQLNFLVKPKKQKSSMRPKWKSKNYNNELNKTIIDSNKIF